MTWNRSRRFSSDDDFRGFLNGWKIIESRKLFGGKGNYETFIAKRNNNESSKKEVS